MSAREPAPADTPRWLVMSLTLHGGMGRAEATELAERVWADVRIRSTLHSVETPPQRPGTHTLHDDRSDTGRWYWLVPV